jgi:hypothetical protein
MMTYALYILVALATVVLCAVGIVPSQEFVELLKWVVIVYAGSMTVITVADVFRARAPKIPDFDSCFPYPNTVPLAQQELDPAPAPPWGSLEGNVFSNPIGTGVPARFTNFVRSPDAPPTMTDAGDGSEIPVPLESYAVPPHPLGWRATAAPGHAEPWENGHLGGDDPRLFFDGDPRNVPSKDVAASVVHVPPRKRSLSDKRLFSDGDITSENNRAPVNRGLAEREKRVREANAEPNIVVLGDLESEIPKEEGEPTQSSTPPT